MKGVVSLVTGIVGSIFAFAWSHIGLVASVVAAVLAGVASYYNIIYTREKIRDLKRRNSFPSDPDL